MFCVRCGTEMSDNALACPKCGEPIKGAVKVGKKSRVTYVVLGLILGGLGIHNFYAGYAGRGVFQLLITVLSLGFLCWVSCIWALIEICTVTKDASGNSFA